MTKERLPLSIENALFKVLGEIGLTRAVELTGHAEAYLRAMGDPDRRERLSIDVALKLDLEHHAITGRGYPIFEAYDLLVKTASEERFSDAITIQLESIDVIRETGQACAAIVAASLPNAGPAERLEAAHKLEEAEVQIRHAIPLLMPRTTEPPT